MTLTIEQLTKEYDEKKYLYEKLVNEIATQINALLDNKDITLANPIEKRVKKLDSILLKCDRYHLNLESLSDINDIAGIRIVVLFKRDIERVCELLTENFNVISKENVAERLLENQFGYSSIHFEVTPKEEWLSLPTLKLLKGLMLEIQLRTASQHIWAASSHILQYKKEKDVPPPLVRTINRAAALLEVVDLEFERVLAEREVYIKDIDENIDTNLNIDTLRYTLDRLLPSENKDANEDYAEVLDDLMYLGINNTAKLAEILNKNMKEVLDYEKFALEQSKAGNGYVSSPERLARNVFYKHAGLTRVALKFEFGEKYEKYMDEKYKGTRKK